MKTKVIDLNIAGFIIRLTFVLSNDTYEYENKFISAIEDYYRNFLVNISNNKVDFTIEIVYSYSLRMVMDKNKEKIFMIFYERLSTKKIRTFYHLSGSQLQIIIRQVTHELLAKHDGFILHASASRINGKATLFLGRSGAGKSTIMTLLSKKFSPLGDDSIILRREGRNYFCYSSSARERNDWFLKQRERIALGSIIFLKKAIVTEVRPITNKNSVLRLITKQLYSEKNDVTRQMRNMINFVKNFDSFKELRFSLRNTEKLLRIFHNYEI